VTAKVFFDEGASCEFDEKVAKNSKTTSCEMATVHFCLPVLVSGAGFSSFDNPPKMVVHF
jgi:hypothetical protein